LQLVEFGTFSVIAVKSS